MGAETLKATTTILSMIFSHSIEYNAGKIIIPLRGYCRHPYPSDGFIRGEWFIPQTDYRTIEQNM